MAKIIFINKEFAGKEIELKRKVTSVGRAQDNLVEIHDASVSAHHCEIHTNDTEVIVREKDSKNGTFVDGLRVEGQRPIRSGQKLRLGEVELRVEIPFREEEDTEITTVLSLDKIEREQREQAERDAESTTNIKATLGEKDNAEEETIIFQAQKKSAQSGASPEANYKEYEPKYIVPEPKSPINVWITVAVVVIVVVAVILYVMN